MKRFKIIFYSILIISFFGCENENSQSLKYSDSGRLGLLNIADVSDDEVQIEKNRETNTSRKLIKNGDIEFEVKDLTESRNIIFNSLKKFNGYLSSDDEYNHASEISNTIVIRIPANHFDESLSEITNGIKKFDRKEITIKDVTEEFLDIDARIKTKKELEKRYLEILKQAKSVTEILAVEKQIGELRSDIESIEGRLKYLENNISFSTLKIRIYQKISEQKEYGGKFKNGFKNGWNNLIQFFVFLINIWPFIIITIGVIILFKKWRKKRKK